MDVFAESFRTMKKWMGYKSHAEDSEFSMPAESFVQRIFSIKLFQNEMTLRKQQISKSTSDEPGYKPERINAARKLKDEKTKTDKPNLI